MGIIVESRLCGESQRMFNLLAENTRKCGNFLKHLTFSARLSMLQDIYARDDEKQSLMMSSFISKYFVPRCPSEMPISGDQLEHSIFAGFVSFNCRYGLAGRML